MNLASLDARNIEARRRINAATASLGETMGVAPLVAPTAIERRQPAVAQMRELEELARLLEAIVATQEITHASP